MYVIKDNLTNEYLLNRTKRAIHNVHPFGHGAVRTFSTLGRAARSAAFRNSPGRALEIVRCDLVESRVPSDYVTEATLQVR